MVRVKSQLFLTRPLKMNTDVHPGRVPLGELSTPRPGRIQVAPELTNLDILRALAVGLVLVGHMLAVLRIRGLGDLGHLGVLLFFVHTSLVLMMSMGRTKLAGSDLRRSFWVRRVFRIYPLSIACVVLFVLFEVPSAFWLSPYAAPDAGTIISNLFLAQNLSQDPSINCVLWSLPFEIQMYALLPFIYVFVTRRAGSPRAVMLLWALSLLLALSEIALRGPGSLLLRYLPCFMAGVLAWSLMGRVRPRFKAAWWMVSLVLLVVAFRVIGVIRVYGLSPWSRIHQNLRVDGGIWWPSELDPVRDWLFCLIAGLLVPLFVQCRVRAIVVPCKAVAKYSYGIYLWHIPVLWLVFSVIGVPAGLELPFALLAVAGTALCAYVGYHVIEDPAVRLGKRLATRVVRGS